MMKKELCHAKNVDELKSKMSETTIENYRRLDVYPTATRICISAHQITPEKSSPRQLRKQISLSEEKIRCSASRVLEKSTHHNDGTTPHVDYSSTSTGTNTAGSIPFDAVQTLEALSRNPVRALRPSAGDSLSPSERSKNINDGWRNILSPRDKTVTIVPDSSAFRSRSSTMSCSEYSDYEVEQL
jgi:hypothetical protein